MKQAKVPAAGADDRQSERNRLAVRYSHNAGFHIGAAAA